jgi:hypothetical protein
VIAEIVDDLRYTMPQRPRLDRTAGLGDELLAEILSHFDFYHRCAVSLPLNDVAGSSCVWHLSLCGWSISSPSEVPKGPREADTVRFLS